ncbi:MAG: Nitroreductase family protein [Candidatus Latescibacteria bacterium ADurb.Bin168]|nr:MAG: Nitroreductase family protein [Candidatus Latescibacteria bacterium ADurb.Bin168]
MQPENDNGTRFSANRYFLKDAVRQVVDFRQTDQARGLPAPSLQKPVNPDARRVTLPDGSTALLRLCAMSLGEAISLRESVRSYSSDALSLEELSALLHATQGVRKVLRPDCALRNVPSAGARHSFETYVAVARVRDLPAGLYRYLPFNKELIELSLDPEISQKARNACLGQEFVSRAAATFFWTTIPARMEWRYDRAAHKVIAVDAGHVCQNLYLACTAMGAGACAIAAYDQDACDRLLGVDGDEEFTVYIATVGKRRRAQSTGS